MFNCHKPDNARSHPSSYRSLDVYEGLRLRFVQAALGESQPFLEKTTIVEAPARGVEGADLPLLYRQRSEGCVWMGVCLV